MPKNIAATKIIGHGSLFGASLCHDAGRQMAAGLVSIRNIRGSAGGPAEDAAGLANAYSQTRCHNGMREPISAVARLRRRYFRDWSK
jgi:hypothetical protein